MLARPVMMRYLLDTYLLSLMTKRGRSFGYESSYTHRGRVSIGDFCYGECSYFERCSEDFMYLFLFFLF